MPSNFQSLSSRPSFSLPIRSLFWYKRCNYLLKMSIILFHIGNRIGINILHVDLIFLSIAIQIYYESQFLPGIAIHFRIALTIWCRLYYITRRKALMKYLKFNSVIHRCHVKISRILLMKHSVVNYFDKYRFIKSHIIQRWLLLVVKHSSES